MLSSIVRYPIKGFSGELLEKCEVIPGTGVRGDRAYAVYFSDPKIVPDPQGDWRKKISWQEKHFFLDQNDWPGLASLKTKLHGNPKELSVEQGGKTVFTAPVDDEGGRKKIDQFFTQFFGTLTHFKSSPMLHQKPPLYWVGGGGDRYPDRKNYDVSILNLASLADLSRRLSLPLEIERFRGNLLLEGFPPWEEINWVGKKIRVGNLEFSVIKPIGRCNNINVHPQKGVADIPLLQLLAKETGKANFGVLATLTTAGVLQRGDRVLLV